jgi:predicted GIY-YIG superfamily endonuclease
LGLGCPDKPGNDRVGCDGVKNYYVYILANRKNGTLYIGATNDIVRRVYQHKNGITGVSSANTAQRNLSGLKTHQKLQAPFSVRNA